MRRDFDTLLLAVVVAIVVAGISSAVFFAQAVMTP